jgi:hypothetical protein
LSKIIFSKNAIFILLTLLCLSLAAVHPFLLGKLPLTADGTLHLYRLVSLDHALRHGDLWPRYVPGMAYGYGAPFFNYYAPLSLYPLEALHLLGMSFVQAWLWGMVFYTLVGAVGAYLLGKAWGGKIAGIITAVAYTYAPYMLYDSVWRGTIAEFASLVLLPYCFWSLHQLATYGRRRDLFAAVLSLALFIPMHNVITLHGAVLLAIYAAFLWWKSDSRRRTFVQLALAFALGFGLTAFFWLPALTETGYVKINEITAALPDIDVTRNLTPLSSVFAPPITADPTQLQPPIPIALGWPQLTLGILALVLALIKTLRRKEAKVAKREYSALSTQHSVLILSAFLLVALIFMTTPASASIWQVIPLIRYSQFPWRLIGPASLLLALMAGVGAAFVLEQLKSRFWRVVWLALCVVVLTVYAMPYLYPSYPPVPSANSIVDAQNFERETGWIATSSFGEYIPRWSQTLPDSTKLIDRYEHGEVIPRLEPPPGVTITDAEWGLTSGKLRLTAESETTLIFDWFYFPGWHATLDGADLPLAPSDPHGLLSATIPPGDHTLEIALGLTPTQSIATLISLFSLFGLGIVLVLGFSLSTQHSVPSPQSSPLITHHSLLITALAIFAFKLIVLDPAQTPIKRERFVNGVESGVQHPLNANFENIITLLGYDLLDAPTPSGEQAQLNLYWRLNSDRIHEDYSSLIVLRDIAGNEIYRTESFYPGGIASKNWLPGYYIQERLTLDIPPATPPGVYTIEVALYEPESTRSLNVMNAQGNPEDVKIAVGSLEITRPIDLNFIKKSELQDSLGLTGLPLIMSDDLDFVGVKPLPEQLQVGESFTLDWYWYAAPVKRWNYEPRPLTHGRLVWLSQGGQIAASSPELPLAIGYPTTEWYLGDIWRGLHTLYVPGRLEAGEYEIAIQLVHPIGQRVSDLNIVTKMQVTAPPRSFDIPDITHPTQVKWSNGILLLGYDFLQDESLTLRLYWQPQLEINTSLRFFVHLVDSEEHIVAQHDGVPLNWTRPTTSWAPGEVLADMITLTLSGDIPAGDYQLKLGWYDPLTKARVTLRDGSDVYTLAQTVTVK